MQTNICAIGVLEGQERGERKVIRKKRFKPPSQKKKREQEGKL